MATIGQNIRKITELRGINFKELADKSKVPPETISRIINDKRRPRWSTLKRIAMALDVTTVAILCGDFPIENNISEETMLSQKNLGKNIQRICKELDITDKELANMAALDLKTIQSTIRGSRKAKINTIKHIADALNTTVENLLA